MGEFNGQWLSQEDLIFHRLSTFHRQRVEALAAGSSPLFKFADGAFVVHLIPEECLIGRNRFTASELKTHGQALTPFGSRYGEPQFNVDGFIVCHSSRPVGAYSQLSRDGRLEAAMSGITYQQNTGTLLRTATCEQSIFRLVEQYLKFCKDIGLKPPIWLFAALVSCEKARISTPFLVMSPANAAIDRSPAYLPEIEIKALDLKAPEFLRPFCDSIWQAANIEHCKNYDQSGVWHEPQ